MVCFVDHGDVLSPFMSEQDYFFFVFGRTVSFAEEKKCRDINEIMLLAASNIIQSIGVSFASNKITVLKRWCGICQGN